MSDKKGDKGERKRKWEEEWVGHKAGEKNSSKTEKMVNWTLRKKLCIPSQRVGEGHAEGGQVFSNLWPAPVQACVLTFPCSCGGDCSPGSWSAPAPSIERMEMPWMSISGDWKS